VRAQVLGSPAENRDPDRAEATSGLCDPAAVAVLAVAVQEVADRGSATGEIQTQLQDDFARMSRRTLNKRMGDFDGRHNTALPVGTAQNCQQSSKQEQFAGDPPERRGFCSSSMRIKFVITFTSIAPCLPACYFLLSSTKACRSVSPFALLFFSQDFRLNVQSKAVLMNRR
jgi:hypothetical protein